MSDLDIERRVALSLAVGRYLRSAERFTVAIFVVLPQRPKVGQRPTAEANQILTLIDEPLNLRK